jgi:NADH-quinone oxidoreductase subunit L
LDVPDWRDRHFGVPGFAGFFSKDEILFRTFASGHLALARQSAGFAVDGDLHVPPRVLLRAFAFRFGHASGDSSHGSAPQHASTSEPQHLVHLHDAPPAIALRAVVLRPVRSSPGTGLGGRFERFLEPSFSPRAAAIAVEGPGTLLMVISSLVAVAGIAVAAAFFLANKDRADRVAERFAGLYQLLVCRRC